MGSPPRAGVYPLITDFGYDADEKPDTIAHDVFWIVAIVRLGMPLSFSRRLMTSVTKDLTQGALLRAEKPLVITDDVVHFQVSASKRSHKTSFSASLKQTDVNYLVEILPGDWCFAWLVNNRTDHERLLRQIDGGQACNDFLDGLKFIGRVSSVRKRVSNDPNGPRDSSYSLSCTGFDELDTHFFYDNSLASKDVLERDYGQWLVRMGLDVKKLFGDDAKDGLSKNNINRIIPTLLDLIVGKGPGSQGDIPVAAAGGQTVSATPQLSEEAPYAYTIPVMAAKLLGKTERDDHRTVLGYSDILELLSGVQTYSNKTGWQVFVPDLSSDSTPQRRTTPNELLGTFLPFMPDFANKPLWSVMQQYLNPTINEMYTALRVNPEGKVVPTIVLRQIPFTTEAMPEPADLGPDDSGDFDISQPQGDMQDVSFTRFLSLPRWGMPASLVQSVDIGRSDATRINMVHVYGTSSYQQNAIPVQEQIVNNPPVIDHLDVMRSGMRPYMATVECWVDDTVGKAPRAWMYLVADWTIGSHLTLNGTLDCYGIQAPICVGDNIAFDGVVYHIEGVMHNAHIAGDGKKAWTTSLQLSNGMRDNSTFAVDNELESGAGAAPIYPGFEQSDNTGYDPGLTLEGQRTTGGSSDEPGAKVDQVDAMSQLDPKKQEQ